MSRTVRDHLARYAGEPPKLDDATFERLASARPRRSRWAVTMMVFVVIGVGVWALYPGLQVVEFVEGAPPGEGAGVGASGDGEGAADAGGDEGHHGDDRGALGDGEGSADAGGDEGHHGDDRGASGDGEGPADASGASGEGAGAQQRPASELAPEVGWPGMVLAIEEIEETPEYEENWVVDTQQALDDAWLAFGVDAVAPELPEGHHAIVVGVPGTCRQPADLRHVEPVPAVNEPGSVAAVQYDEDCLARPPNPPSDKWWLDPDTVYAIAIPDEDADGLLGAVATTPGMAAVEWDVLLVSDPVLGVTAPAGGRYPEGVQWAWDTFHLTGDPPQARPGWELGAYQIPGNCDAADAVRDVGVMGRLERLRTDGGTSAELGLAIVVDPACAETRLDGPPGVEQSDSLLVLETPIGLLDVWDPGWVLLDCAAAPDAGGCQDHDPRLVDVENYAHNPPEIDR